MVLGIALIVFGVAALNGGAPSEEGPNLTSEEKEVKEGLELIISDLLKKDVTASELNKKYSVDYFNDSYMAFEIGNILSYKALLTNPNDNQKKCISFVDENYDEMIKIVKDSVDYDFTLDTETQTIDMQIKSYKLKDYHLVLTKLTEEVIEKSGDDNAYSEEANFFSYRCQTLTALAKYTDEFITEDYLPITTKYEVVDGKLLLEDYTELGRALTGFTYQFKASEEDPGKVDEEVTRIVDKIYEAEFN